MLIQVPNRNRLVAMLMSISFIPSNGYQIALNESGYICPVLSSDESMNVVFKSNTMTCFEVEKMLKLTIPDIDSFKKFFKNIPARDATVEYDEHLNSISCGNTKLSLNGPDVIPGKITSTKPLMAEWFRVEIEEIGPLFDMCTHTKIGDKVEITNRKINLHTWNIKVSVIDNNHEEVGEEFKTYLDRDMLKTISKIHKKIGDGSMYIKIYRDPNVPLVQVRGDGANYTAYCGKYNEGKE